MFNILSKLLLHFAQHSSHFGVMKHLIILVNLFDIIPSFFEIALYCIYIISFLFHKG